MPESGCVRNEVSSRCVAPGATAALRTRYQPRGRQLATSVAWRVTMRDCAFGASEAQAPSSKVQPARRALVVILVIDPAVGREGSARKSSPGAAAGEVLSASVRCGG